MNIEKKIQNFYIPTLTRWWTLGVSANHLSDRWDEWKQLLHNLTKLHSKIIPPVVMKIIKKTLGLMRIPELKWDIMFFDAVYSDWIAPHFAYLQLGDPLTNHCPGYQARLINVRYYLMQYDLNKYKNNGWLNHDSFAKLNEYMKTNIPVALHDKLYLKARHSFRIMTDILHKHFWHWLNRNIHFAIFSEQPMASIVLNVIFGTDFVISPNNNIYHSMIHKRDIDLLDFEKFVREVSQNIDISMLNGLPLNVIMNGVDIWDTRNADDVEVIKLIDFYMYMLSSAGSNTKNLERAVKLSKACSNRNRKENLTSEYDIVKWKFMKEVSPLALNCHKDYVNEVKRKKELKKYDCLRYKSGAMASINLIEKINEADIESSIAYAKKLTNQDISYEIKRDEKIVSNFTNLFSFDVIPESDELPDDTPLLRGRVTYSKLRKAKHTCHIVHEITV